KIELRALAATQGVETRKLESELGITQAQKGAELGLEKSKQAGLLSAFETKRQGEFKYSTQQQLKEWQAREAEYDVDALRIGAETQLALDNNILANMVNGN